ncbi:hypothetical protein Ae505Ps2_2388c [Pseudonocardia sp. Ae505_Ps2]|nr:hypothetical protein Ae505Ps2_2388c [Pseudonocardia sp. Ae505_Ps2]
MRRPSSFRVVATRRTFRPPEDGHDELERVRTRRTDRRGDLRT